ncbi:hypothetical protein LXL04_036026 [Taraxacum kok-saghyz]
MIPSSREDGYPLMPQDVGVDQLNLSGDAPNISSSKRRRPSSTQRWQSPLLLSAISGEIKVNFIRLLRQRNSFPPRSRWAASLICDRTCSIPIGSIPGRFCALDGRFQTANIGNGMSFAVAVQGLKNQQDVSNDSHSLVLDDSCLNLNDQSFTLVGKVKEFGSLLKLADVLSKEGFHDVVIRYMGGFWVSFEFKNAKVIVQGKVFHIRAREVIGWNPEFVEDEEEDNEEDNDTSWPLGFTPPKPSVVVDSHSNSSPSSIPAHIPTAPSSILAPNPPMADEQAEESMGDSKQDHEKVVALHSESFLKKLDDFVLLGETMGYNMEGWTRQKAKLIWVKELCSKHKVNFLALQETKMESVDDFFVRRLWGNSNFKFSFSDSVGASGGILCVWDSGVFVKRRAALSDYFVLLEGTWVPTQSDILIVTVYAPHDVREKRMLWDYLGEKIGIWSGDVMVMGYFNEVRFPSDRFGSSFNAQGANVFNDFIAMAGLHDVALGGYMYTWAHPTGEKMSKLERFLFSESMLEHFPHVSALVLDKHLSDHRPILLREVAFDYGPTPFRVFHSWLTKDSFGNLVADSWLHDGIVGGNLIVRLKNKLKFLKNRIRTWVKENRTFGKMDLKEALLVLDRRLDAGEMGVVEERNVLFKSFIELEKSEAVDLAQKAKIKWAIEGDENSKYFHSMMNKTRSRLAIRGILVDGDWVDEPTAVKREFFHHFAERFAPPPVFRIRLNMTLPRVLSLDQHNGFTFEFIRKYWAVIGGTVVEAVQEFFRSGVFPRGCNPSFIALIPKVPNAKFVKDFRPISLIGCQYKIVAKLLANRLKMVIGDLVSDPQSAFVAGRQILDGPLILNEVVSWCKAKKKKAMVFKVDFEKAYDSVRWDFLLDILEAFGFGANWCRWIHGCLASSIGSALVNGSPTEEFHFQRGLRQGDPLSPFLFILVMEVLHISMHRAMKQGFFRPLRIGDTLHISHLFYADNAINIQKSKILGICVAGGEVEQVASLVGCAPLKLPFTYLGVKVDGVMSRSTAWEEVAKKRTAKLSNWKLKTLSVGGRLALIKSVLGSLPIYNMSLFKVRMGVLKTLEQLRSRFFRGVDHGGNKMAWISWDKVCASKEKGGLGVGSFYALNRVLLFKWVWRFKSQPGAFWVTVVKAIHGSEDHIGSPRASVWRDILRSRVDLVNKWIDLKQFCNKLIGDGVNTRFWKEVWLGNYMLHTAFPRLFALEEDKDVSVTAKFMQPWNASFRRPMLGGAEEAQGQEHYVDDTLLGGSSSTTRWVSMVPIKINVFAWKMMSDALPTRWNLSQRGIELNSMLCPICGEKRAKGRTRMKASGINSRTPSSSRIHSEETLSTAFKRSDHLSTSDLVPPPTIGLLHLPSLPHEFTAKPPGRCSDSYRRQSKSELELVVVLYKLDLCVRFPEHPTVCRLDFRFRSYDRFRTTAQKSIRLETELAEERTEDHGTTSSQPRRSDRGGFPYRLRRYFYD